MSAFVKKTICIIVVVILILHAPIGTSILGRHYMALSESTGLSNPVEKEIKKGSAYDANTLLDVRSEENDDVSYLLRIHYEFRPYDIDIKKGHLIEGITPNLHKNDGKSLLLIAENCSNTYEVSFIAYFKLRESGQIVLCCNSTNSSIVYVDIYNQTTELYERVSEFNVNTSIKRNVYNFTSDENELRIWLRFLSSTAFNITISYLIGVSVSKNLRLTCEFASSSVLRYELRVDGVYSGTKIVFENMTKFMRLEGAYGPPHIWNYSEPCVYVLGDGDLQLSFIGYDVWNYPGDLGLEVNFYCGDERIDPKYVDSLYMVTSNKVLSLNEDAPIFENRIKIVNTNPYDIYDAPLKVVINNSWINLLATRENLSDLSFYVTSKNSTVKLRNYLYKWDGATAIFYIELPKIDASSSLPIYIRYGGASVDAHNDTRALYFGNSFAELSNASLWSVREGKFSVKYDADYDVVRIDLYDAEDPIYAKAIFSNHISGRLSGKLRVVSTIKNSNCWEVDYFLVYINDGSFVKLSLRNVPDLGLIEILVIQRVYGKEEVLFADYKSLSYPFDYVLSFEISPLRSKLHVNLWFLYDDYNPDIMVDINPTLLNDGWFFGIASRNMTLLDLALESWKQEMERPLVIGEISGEKLICNLTYNQTVSGWKPLNESTIWVPPLSKISIKLFDAFDKPLLLYETNVSTLHDFSIDIPINATLLVLHNDAFSPKIISISKINDSQEISVNTFSEKYVLVALGRYTLDLREPTKGNTSIVVFNLKIPGVLRLNISSCRSLLESILSSTAELIFYYEYKNLGYVDTYRNDFLLLIANYSKLSSHIYRFFSRMEVTLNEVLDGDMLVEEFNSLDNILAEITNDTMYRNISAININLVNNRIDYVDSSGIKSIRLNLTTDELLNKLANVSNIFRASLLMMSFAMKYTSDEIGWVRYDGSARRLTIISKTDMWNFSADYSQNHVRIIMPLSSLSDSTKVFIFSLDSAHILGGIRPIVGDVFSVDLYSNLTIYSNVVEISLRRQGIESEKIYVDLSKKTATVYRPDIGGSTISYRFDEGILVVNGKRIRSDLLYMFVRDLLFNSQKYVSMSSETSILNEYTRTIEKKCVRIIDYYLQKPFPEGLLIITLNKTINTSKSILQFWTSSVSSLIVTVRDVMGNVLNNVTSASNTLVLYVKVGVIVILNDINSSLQCEITAEGKRSLNITVNAKSVLSIFLKINMSYYIVLSYADKIVLNVSIQLYDSDTLRPSYFLVVHEEQNSALNETTNTTLSNGEDSKKSEVKEGESEFLLFAVALSIMVGVGIFVSKIILNKLKERRTISAERLVESLISETESASIPSQNDES